MYLLENIKREQISLIQSKIEGSDRVKTKVLQ
jgi:hypothetical protein